MGAVSRQFPATARVEIRKLKQLPPIPAELQQLLRVVRDDSTTLDQLYAAVESSPGLAARLLGLANSAYFGQAGAVHTIRQAIYQVLGLNTVKSLVYTQLLQQTLDTSRCVAFRSEQFWSESLLTAIFAQRLARMTASRTHVDEGVAYTAGLLANLGLLALVHTFPDEMAAELLLADQNHTRLSRHLSLQLGMDQYRAGAWLAARWHFPDALCRAIAQMASDAIQPADPLASMLRLAHSLARQCYRGDEDADAQAALAAELGLDQTCLSHLRDSVAAKRQELAETAHLLGKSG